MDKRWIQGCREGDALAIEQLVDNYQERIYRLVLSILDDPGEAEDGTQEVFLAALRALDSFRGEASFTTWLYSIAINVCRNRLKTRRRHERIKGIFQELFHQTADRSSSLEEWVIKDESDAVLWQAIRAIDDKHRLPIILGYYHDLPVAEIAEMLDIPAGTVHSRLNAARKTLQRALNDKRL
jgi:RNA polymerase sigma-70 factor (ECF subfamily)